jgi:DNA-binding NarL/FixJ family response regulator
VTVRTAIATEDPLVKRVLVVADTWPPALAALRDALDGSDIHIVHVCSSRREALSFLEEAEVEVVIVRLGLPESVGVEVVTDIRRRFPTPEVVVSGPFYQNLLIEALKAGVGDYVNEDADLLEIVDAIERAARRS